MFCFEQATLLLGGRGVTTPQAPGAPAAAAVVAPPGCGKSGCDCYKNRWNEKKKKKKWLHTYTRSKFKNRSFQSCSGVDQRCQKVGCIAVSIKSRLCGQFPFFLLRGFKIGRHSSAVVSIFRARRLWVQFRGLGPFWVEFACSHQVLSGERPA